MTSLAQDLTEQLKRQLSFLRTSTFAYDRGQIEEAVRIAVVIRVLCHDTVGKSGRQGSTSLLTHMGKKGSVQLVTTAAPAPTPLPPNTFGELLRGMTFGNDITYDSVPEGSSTVICTTWWNQVVFFRDNVALSRKDVVCTAANKDGGAHVDINPDATFQALQEGFWVRTQTAPDGTTTTESLMNNHFRMLRRFADELLSSQELLALA